jgi:hypothetical protein
MPNGKEQVGAVETLAEGTRYRIKHTRISEGKVTKVHSDPHGNVVLYDLEFAPGSVRRIPAHALIDHKELTDA